MSDNRQHTYKHNLPHSFIHHSESDLVTFPANTCVHVLWIGSLQWVPCEQPPQDTCWQYNQDFYVSGICLLKMWKEVGPNFKEVESRPLELSLGFVSNDSQTWHISADSNLVYGDKKSTWMHMCTARSINSSSQVDLLDISNSGNTLPVCSTHGGHPKPEES